MKSNLQKDVQKDKKIIKKEGDKVNNNEELLINIKQELTEENQYKKEKEIISQQIPEMSNKKGDKDDNKLEEDIPEDIDIKEDEYQRLLLGGADYSDKIYKYNTKGNSSNNMMIQSEDRLKNKKHNKKPFIVTIIDSPNKIIKILLNASSFREESIMPIWCLKDTYIKFKVKGKWRIDKLYQYTDSKGLPSNNKGGFGYGALIGRIGKGDKFIVSNNKAILVKEEGPLYMKQLLPMNMKVDPEGSLEVIVFDGEYMDIDRINQKIGWIENNQINSEQKDDDDNENKNKKEEKMIKEFGNRIRNEINNLRMNPVIFYDQYISKTKNLNQTRNYLKQLSAEYRGVLNPIDVYYDAVLSYLELYTQNKNKKNVNRSNVANYLLELEQEVAYFLSNKFERNTKVKCRLTQKTNPKDIIIQCFYDKKYRFYIFNKKCLDLCVNVIHNFYKDFSLIVMAFAFESTAED